MIKRKTNLKGILFVLFIALFAIVFSACARKYKITGDIDLVETDTFKIKEENGVRFASVKKNTKITFRLNTEKLDKKKEFVKAYYIKEGDSNEYIIEKDSDTSVVVDKNITVKVVYKEFNYVGIKGDVENIENAFTLDTNISENKDIIEKEKIKDGKKVYRSGSYAKVNLKKYFPRYRMYELKTIRINDKLLNDGDTFRFPDKEYVNVSLEDNKNNPKEKVNLSLNLDDYNIKTKVLGVDNFTKGEYYVGDKLEFDLTNARSERERFITGLKINGKEYKITPDNKKFEYEITEQNLNIEVLYKNKKPVDVLFDGLKLSPNFILEKHYDFKNNELNDLDNPVFYGGDKLVFKTRKLNAGERLTEVLENNKNILSESNLLSQEFSHNVSITDSLEYKFVSKMLNKVNVKLDEFIKMTVSENGVSKTYTNQEVNLYPYTKVKFEVIPNSNYNLAFNKILNSGKLFSELDDFIYELKEDENLDLKVEFGNLDRFYKLEIIDHYKDDENMKTLINDGNPKAYYLKNQTLKLSVKNQDYVYKKIKINDEIVNVDKNDYEFELKKDTKIEILEDSISLSKVRLNYTNELLEKPGYENLVNASNNLVNKSENILNNLEDLTFSINDSIFSENIAKFTKIYAYDKNGELIQDADANITYSSDMKKVTIKVSSKIKEIKILNDSVKLYSNLTIKGDKTLLENALSLNIDDVLYSNSETKLLVEKDKEVIFNVKDNYYLNHYLLNNELKKVDFISKITLKLEKHTTIDFSSESTFTKKDDVYENYISSNEYYEVSNNLDNSLTDRKIFVKEFDLDYLYINNDKTKVAFKKLSENDRIIKLSGYDDAKKEYRYKYVNLKIKLYLQSATLNKVDQHTFETDKFHNKDLRKTIYEFGGQNLFNPFKHITYIIHDGKQTFTTANAVDLDLTNRVDFKYKITMDSQDLVLGRDYEIVNGYYLDFSKLAQSLKAKGEDRKEIHFEFYVNDEKFEFDAILVNDGLNVYDQKTLYELFNKDGESYLILQRNILLEMRPEQYSSKRHPDFNSDPDPDIRAALGEYSNSVAFDNKHTNSYFYRDKNAKFTFNGNFFALDASKTPKMLIENGWTHHKVADPAAGVIGYFPSIESDQQFSLKNTKIISNTTHPDASHKPSDKVPMWASGGLFSVYAVYGKININNCDLQNASTSIYIRKAEVKLENTRIDNSYNASIFFANDWTASTDSSREEKLAVFEQMRKFPNIMKLEMENTVLLRSGGPAGAFSDMASERRGYYLNGKYVDESKEDYISEPNILKMKEVNPHNDIPDDLYRASYNLDPSFYFKHVVVENLTDGKSDFFKAFGLEADKIIAQLAKEAFGVIGNFVDDSKLHKCHVNSKGEINLAFSFQNPCPGIPEKPGSDMHFRQAHDINYWDDNLNKYIRVYNGADYRYGKGMNKQAPDMQEVINAALSIISSPGYNLIDMYNRVKTFAFFAEDLNKIETKIGLMGGGLYTGLTGEYPKLKGIHDKPFGIGKAALRSIFYNSMNKNEINNALTNAYMELMPGEIDIPGTGKLKIGTSIYIGVFNNDVPEWMLK